MNSSRIDIKYAQTGPVCVFASYAIITKYFSKNRKDICELMNKYVQVFQTNPTNHTALAIENSIHQHYHTYCRANNLRGFPFIANQHNADTFLTSKYSVPVKVAVNNGTIPLSRQHNITLKKRLKRGGLAMVLTNNRTHAIVVGYDKRKDGYFYRNPTRNNGQVLIRTDFLKNNNIFEYILFERKKRY